MLVELVVHSVRYMSTYFGILLLWQPGSSAGGACPPRTEAVSSPQRPGV